MLADALQHIDEVGVRIDLCSRQVTIRLWMMPTCLAPSSVQQKSQFLRPIGIGAQGALQMVGVDRHVGIGEEHLEAVFAFADVVQRLDERVAGASPCCSSCRST